MTELAYLNGVFCPIGEARVSIEDRGFQFGDGVYEVIVAYDGRLFLCDQHMRRLRRSAAAIQVDYDFGADRIEPIITEGLKRSGLSDAMIYIQITRGAAARRHEFPAGTRPTLAMTFKPRPLVPEELRRRGVSLMTVPDTRWSHCYIKAITLLPNVLAKNEAIRKGYDDAIFVTESGEVRECTAANVFAVRDGRMLTPPCCEAVLEGVTQGFIVECARSIGLEVSQKPLGIDTVRGADEAFLSSTTSEILSITRIDDRSIGDGNPGPITNRLFKEFVRRSRGDR